MPDGLLTNYPALKVEFFREAGQRRQNKTSENLKTWANLHEPFTGRGGIFRKLYSAQGTQRVFNCVEKVQ